MRTTTIPPLDSHAIMVSILYHASFATFFGCVIVELSPAIANVVSQSLITMMSLNSGLFCGQSFQREWVGVFTCVNPLAALLRIAAAGAPDAYAFDTPDISVAHADVILLTFCASSLALMFFRERV